MDKQELLKTAKPILFNSEMVRAILDGEKTVTRRAVKNGKRTPVGAGRDKFYTFIDTLNGKPFIGAGFYKHSDIFAVDGVYHTDAEYFKMRYKIGDILYVRETAMIQSMKNFEKSVKLLFRADDRLQEFKVSDVFYEKLSNYSQAKWLSPYYLTKEVARIFLKVTDIRVERLQDITVDECCREGCCSSDCYGIGKHSPDCKCDARFINTWNSTIKPADLPLYGWNANPWVWVYDFEVIEHEQRNHNSK